jgi:hypothetical protein
LSGVVTFLKELNPFENISDIDFGLLSETEDVEKINEFLDSNVKVTGVGFEILHETLDQKGFDIKYFFSPLKEEKRLRITRLYHHYRDIENSPSKSLFELFPNLTHYFVVTAHQLNEASYAKKLGSILNELPKTKIKELALLGPQDFSSVAAEVSAPLRNIKKVRLATTGWPYCQDFDGDLPIEIADVVGVFPEAKDVSIQHSKVVVDRKKLNTLQGKGINASWDRLYLSTCSFAYPPQDLDLWHPTFSSDDFTVSHNKCRNVRKILVGPTKNEIKNLLHDFIVNLSVEEQPQCKD